MKTKKKTYILLVLVTVVWGIIAYQIITGLNPEVPVLETQQVMAVKSFKLNTKIDTFSISKAERDPFLGTITKKKTNTKIIKKRKALEWQPIDYLGLVNNSNQKSQVFIINISGKQYLLKKGQIKDSIKLLGGNRNRVTLRYKNEQKIVSIKKE